MSEEIEFRTANPDRLAHFTSSIALRKPEDGLNRTVRKSAEVAKHLTEK
jgi:hypothetical protein